MNNKRASSLGMVDISQKSISIRRAVATASIRFEPKAFSILLKQGSPKGDLFEVARVAGIMAAKSTPSIIPLCHPINLDKINVDLKTIASKRSILVTAEVISTGKTGVEMEALAAVSAASLTIYDMMKWSGQTMVISDIRLLHKSGGKSGTYIA